MQLGATASRSLGETREEQLAFTDVALGLLDLQLQPTANGRPADVLLMDQRIELDGQPHLIGTTVAEELHRRGFGGVVVIVSGTGKVKLTELRTLPGIDLVMGKSDVFSGRMTRRSATRSRQRERWGSQIQSRGGGKSVNGTCGLAATDAVTSGGVAPPCIAAHASGYKRFNVIAVDEQI